MGSTRPPFSTHVELGRVSLKTYFHPNLVVTFRENSRKLQFRAYLGSEMIPKWVYETLVFHTCRTRYSELKNNFYPNLVVTFRENSRKPQFLAYLGSEMTPKWGLRDHIWGPKWPKNGSTRPSFSTPVELGTVSLKNNFLPNLVVTFRENSRKPQFRAYLGSEMTPKWGLWDPCFPNL